MRGSGITGRYLCYGCGMSRGGTSESLPDGWKFWNVVGFMGPCYCSECADKLETWRFEVLSDAIQSRPRDVISDIPPDALLVRYLDQETFTSKGYSDSEGD